VLSALFALGAAEAAMLVAIASDDSDEGNDQAVASEAATGGTARRQPAGARSDAHAVTSTGRRDDEDAIEAAVGERLGDLREQKRERFVSALAGRVEEGIGRALSGEEREALSQSNRDYFSAVDERGRVESPDARDDRLDAARRTRLEALGRIAGSEGEAARMLDEAMNAPETEPGASGGASSGTEKPSSGGKEEGR
jgi:hypothetical protein